MFTSLATASSRSSRRSPQQLAASCSLLAGLFAAALWAGPALADNDDHQGGGAVRLLSTIPVPGVGMRGFDISWVDAATQRYYLADRSNKAVDVVDAKNGTFLKQITGGAAPFAGAVLNAAGAANNDVSGPNGVVSSGRWLFVTDAPSRVVTIDLTTDLIVSDVRTSATSAKRADELAYDPDSGTLLVVNNADDPPFATLITVDKGTGKLTVGKKIIFDMSHSGFDATNGAEQPVWDTNTGRFYISIPEINCTTGVPPCGGMGINGAVARISRTAAAVDAVFPVQFCQPAGLTLGPKQDLLLGCGVAFDTAGNAWTTTDPNTAAPISVIMDARNGSIDKMVTGVTGSDEVWFNSGDGRYYLAARNQPGGPGAVTPVLGVIDAKSQTLVQVVPTINTAGKPFVFPSGSAHSVAVNPNNNHAFVPLPANNVFPNCLTGCIAVFGTPRDADND